MSEYADHEMRWAAPREHRWDSLYGKRARRQLCYGGAFGHANMVAGRQEGQARCMVGIDRFTFKEVSR